MNYFKMNEDGSVEPTIAEFAKFGQRVARTEIDSDVFVSTVFLALDHAFNGGVPILFETMIFEGEHDQAQWRYHTRAEALMGHDLVVASLRTGQPLP